jgi:hypothetical protein
MMQQRIDIKIVVLSKNTFTKSFYTSGSKGPGINSHYRMTNSLMYIDNVPKLRFCSFRMGEATGKKFDLMERRERLIAV